MKINDLEKLLDIKRSNIFFYEREGLITPCREDNNYREYSEDDLRRLKAILVFRKLGLTVEEIRALLAGDRALSDVLAENMARLAEKQTELAGAMALCRDMQARGLTMDEFDADGWFDTVHAQEKTGRRFLDMVGDTLGSAAEAMAFAAETTGLYGPVYAMYFFSPEGIRKRRMLKLYWIAIAFSCLSATVLPLIFPQIWVPRADPLAAVMFYIGLGISGTVVMALCARYVIPRCKPRNAFWITVLAMVAVNLCLGLVGRQAARPAETDGSLAGVAEQYLTTEMQAAYMGDDPVGYVRETWLEPYGSADAELDVFEADGVMLVLTSTGSVNIFYQVEDGQWVDGMGIERAVNGVIYTAKAYGLSPWPTRLMDAAGNIYEPVYEKHFAGGYLPVYAFDVSAGQEYACVMFGVDEAGNYHYDCCGTGYYGLSDWTAADGQLAYEHTLSELYRTAAGPELLAAYKDWRAEIWQTEPVYMSSGPAPLVGIGSDCVFSVSYTMPPSLAIQPDSYLPARWGLNEFSERLYLWDGGYVFGWIQNCDADVLSMTLAGTVTADMLRNAAASVALQSAGGYLWDETFGQQPYGAIRSWAAEPPEALLALGADTFRALNR